MRFLIFLSFILMPLSFALADAEIPADKNVIVFPSELGDVAFNHQLHSTLTDVGGLEKVKCSTCHHTYEGEGAVKPCTQCHIRGKKAAEGETLDLKKAFHYRCRNCHKYTMRQGKHSGPDKKCSLCHIMKQANPDSRH